MRKTLMSLLVLSLLFSSAAILPAQEEVKKPTAEKKLKSIMDELTESFRAWRKSEQDKMKKAMEAAEKAKAEGKEAPSMPAMSMSPPKGMFETAIKKIQTAAADYKGQDGAIDMHATILQLSGMTEDKAAAKAAADALTTEHIKSEKIADSIMVIVYSKKILGQEAVEGYMAKIAKDSPHDSIRGAALLAPYRPALEEGKVDSAPYKEAKAKALAAAKAAQNEAMLAEVNQIIASRENIMPGKIAPDISGVDLDGTAFKLSDYKGKIIMLDFWGDW